MKKILLFSFLLIFLSINFLSAEIPRSIKSWYNEKTELSHEKFLKQFNDYIEKQCGSHHAHIKYIVKSIPAKESKCIQTASNSGANGFYQVMGGSFDALQNIDEGISKFKDYLKLNKGDIEKTLMSYNAGPAGMRSAIKAYNNYQKGNYFNKKKLKVYFRIKRFAKDVIMLASYMYSKDNKYNLGMVTGYNYIRDKPYYNYFNNYLNKS
jgi:hypothetical protein